VAEVGATESFVIVDVVPWSVEVTPVEVPPDGVVTFVVVVQVLFTNWQVGVGVEVVVGRGVTTPTRGTVGSIDGTEMDGTKGTTGAEETMGTGVGAGAGAGAAIGTEGTGTVADTEGIAVDAGEGVIATVTGVAGATETVDTDGTGTDADTEGSAVVPPTVGAGEGVIATVAVPPAVDVTVGTVTPTSCPATETFAVAVDDVVLGCELEGWGAGLAPGSCPPPTRPVGIGEDRETDIARFEPNLAIPAVTTGMLAAN
jgi:hypothetical protein